MFNRQMYENSRPDGMGILEVAGGEGQLFVPLKRTELSGEVTGPLATLCLTQTFGYSSEACDKVLEAAYRFPLPGDAAVTGVHVRFGNVEIVTELKERAKAEKKYAKAVAEGRQAALVTRESPDVFTLHVAGIVPDQDVVIETHYIQLARPLGDRVGWSLRVPLTTAPRYVREDEVNSRYAQGQPLALLRDPGHRFALDLTIHRAGEVTSPTHALEMTPADGGNVQRVRLSAGEVIPDRDCVLVWTPMHESERPSLSLMAYHDREEKQIYFLALVTPPARHEPGSGKPREVILLVDHSGSMKGPKWEAADWAVHSFFSTLDERDRFALGLFHSVTRWFRKRPLPATRSNVAKAVKYLDKNRDAGGTNLGVALEQALGLKRSGDGEIGRHVLIITDAQVSDAARILRLADRESARPDRRRISLLCIDAAPNSFLVNELAERGGGVARFLTSDPDEEDITTALEDVLADWAEPVLVGLQLEIDRRDGLAAGRSVLKSAPHTVIDLGDLPCGRAVWVSGRVPVGRDDKLRFRLTAGGQPVAKLKMSVREDCRDWPALKALFGARRLLGLEYLMNAFYPPDMLRDQLARLGYEPDLILGGAAASVYAENAMQQAIKAIKPLLVRESLRYGIPCAETAFVAVRREKGKPVEGHVIVANALPAGWSEQFLSTGASFSSAVRGGGRVRGAVAMGAGAPVPVAAAPIADAAMMSLSTYKEAGARPAAVTRSYELFSGEPKFADGTAVLFDSAHDAVLPDDARLVRVEVKLDGGVAASRLDRALMLLIYVGDMAVPRARIRLADVLRLGGRRPLNLRKGPGDRVQIALKDPNGTWPAGTEITVHVVIR